LDAVTPGLTLGTLYSSGVGINKTKQHLTLGTLYSSGVGINKTKQHSEDREEGPGGMEEGVRGGEFMDGAFCSSILVSPHLPASQFEE